MTAEHALYQSIILDHNRNPRNFRVMSDATVKADAHNPLCGDWFTVYLKTDADKIAAVSFSGSGCAISKASASVMTGYLEGKTARECAALCAQFEAFLASAPDAPIDPVLDGDIRAFCGVRDYPLRLKCAMIPWRAVLAALNAADQGKRI